MTIVVVRRTAIDTKQQVEQQKDHIGCKGCATGVVGSLKGSDRSSDECGGMMSSS